MAELKNQNNNQGQQSNNKDQDQNRQQGGNQQSDGNNPNADPDWQPATTGAVIDPNNDGRLKENREDGRTKGTTEHSSKAPNVDQDNSGSVNSQNERENMMARRSQDRDEDQQDQ